MGNDCGGPTYKVKLIYVNHRLQDIEAASWCPSFFYTSEDQIVTGFVNGMLLTYIKGLKGVVLLNPFEMQWNLGAKNSSFLKKVTGSFASIKRLFRNYAKPLIQPPIIVWKWHRVYKWIRTSHFMVSANVGSGRNHLVLTVDGFLLLGQKSGM